MKSMLSCVLLFAIVTSSLSQKVLRYRCDYTYIREADGYLKYQEIPANFQEAFLRCNLEGSNLASPSSPAVASAIQKYMSQNKVNCAVHSGIHARFSRGDFFSVDGVPLAKISHTWAKGEPDNFNNQENCLVLLPDGNMADVKCEEPYPYFCFTKASKTMMMNACGTNDFGYVMEPKTGSCYKLHSKPRTWSRAFMACAAEGGHLAIINSDIEAQIIKDLYAKYPDAKIPGNEWKGAVNIGFHDWNERGDWWTINGVRVEESGFANWGPGEPNNKTGEFCGTLLRAGLLNDGVCHAKYPFVCEKSPDSLLCDH